MVIDNKVKIGKINIIIIVIRTYVTVLKGLFIIIIIIIHLSNNSKVVVLPKASGVNPGG